MTKNIDFRREVLISIQRALLGEIYPSIRGIAVGYEGDVKFKIIYYLDREPSEEDYENISDVAGQVLADINFSKVEELCIYTKEPFSKLDCMEAWVYIRREL
ncbi:MULTISPECIES: hypothetical protein [Dyadobacter]|uniref:Uncharacterized protein n=1 Tax=Dyadobacter chenhuakuii TaxID=2909339 RepID=A0A9X1QHK2_9BACT|nr:MULTISPECIES: hypothetical protein [Dyadobacter]MCF2500432.1 hypothetical protein [Dyadobacter chenhuakuii]MCF2516027.1 hypothetical protein [Dyadobacter sp. CY351]